jgi:mutator protein MutT
MVTKLRRILNLESISDKLSRINNIDIELNDISSTISDLALEYTNRNEAKKQLEKSNVGEDILKSVNDRFGVFETEHLKEVSLIKKTKDDLDSEREKLMSDNKISKAYNDLTEYNRFKEAYKQDIVSGDVFNTFLKAKQGKVKYADNIVWNEKGDILIIQRAKTDKSNPEKWVIPGGHVDAGESFETAAKRELQEETGLNVTECKKVGSYSDDNASIEYYQSNVNSQEQEIILETKESQDSKWINPYNGDLDKYEMVFNMKENIKKILKIDNSWNKPTVIKKALEDGLLTQEAIDLLKSNKDYAELIEKMDKKRDPDNIEKNDDEQEEISELKKMIEEHERLIKVLAPHAKMDKKVAAELKIQQSELKEYKKKLDHEEKEVELPEDIEKAINSGLLKSEVVEILKARTGVYADNAQNRKLKRVGQKYGASGQPEQKPSKEGKQEEKTEPKQQTPEELADNAKNASETQLQGAIKDSDNPEVRQAAHNELKRRQDEEHPKEEKFGDPKKEDEPKKETQEDNKKGESTDAKKETEGKPDKKVDENTKDEGGSKNDLETKEGIEAEIKRLRAIDTDDLDELEVISDKIQGLLKKRKSVLEKQSSERKVSFEEYREGFKKLETPPDPHKPDYATEYYEKDQKNLKFNKGEEDSLNEYIGENHEYMRMQLSDPEKYKKEYGDDPNMEKDIENISNFISSNKIKESLSLNRRVKGSGKKFFQGLKEGDVYEDKSFSSTSLTEQSIFGDYNIEILAKKGSNVANANNEGELEYLIDKGSKFRVLKTSDTGIIVELL